MENTIKQFCQAWSKNDFSKMYELCQITLKSIHTKKYLKNLILGSITGYEIISVDFDDKHPCLCDINIKVKHRDISLPSSIKVKELIVRLIKESKPYSTSEEGTWGVNPISVIRNLYVKAK